MTTPNVQQALDILFYETAHSAKCNRNESDECICGLSARRHAAFATIRQVCEEQVKFAIDHIAFGGVNLGTLREVCQKAKRLTAVEQERDALREDVKFSRRAFEIATEQFKKAVKARLDAAPHDTYCEIWATPNCTCWKRERSNEWA